MLKNFKNMIAGWWNALKKAIDNWLREHCKKECSVCNKPTLLKDLKKFHRPGKRTLLVCPDCCSHPEELNKILYRCDRCYNVFTKDSLTEFNDTLLCGTCLNERSFYCPECHNRVIWIRKFVTQSAVKICKPCAEKFKLRETVLSAEARAVLDRCHREAIRTRQNIDIQTRALEAKAILDKCHSKEFSVNSLANFDDSGLGSQRLETLHPQCPICRRRID